MGWPRISGLSYDNRLLCMFTPVLYKLTKDLFFKANFFSTYDAVAFLKKKKNSFGVSV